MPHYPYLPTSPPRIKKGNIWLSLWGRERELVDHENRKKGKKNLSRVVQETIVVDAISGGATLNLWKILVVALTFISNPSISAHAAVSLMKHAQFAQFLWNQYFIQTTETGWSLQTTVEEVKGDCCYPQTFISSHEDSVAQNHTHAHAHTHYKNCTY